MKTKKILALPAALLAGALVLPLAANAAPDNKPVNAATTDSGTLCIVHEADGAPYAVDPDCSWHTVVKRDRDGNLQSYRYQDKGSLQAGQVAPDRAVRIPLTDTLGSLTCTGTEVVTPSGNYSSDIKCK